MPECRCCVRHLLEKHHYLLHLPPPHLFLGEKPACKRPPFIQDGKGYKEFKQDQSVNKSLSHFTGFFSVFLGCFSSLKFQTALLCFVVLYFVVLHFVVFVPACKRPPFIQDGKGYKEFKQD